MTSKLHQALAIHQAGDLIAAERAYTSLLATDPHHAMAIHYRGVIAHQRKQFDHAIDDITRSIQLAPHVPDFHCNLGCVLAELGKLEEAITSFATAIRLRPKYSKALFNLGDVLRRQDKLKDSAEVLRIAISLEPADAQSHKSLSIVLRQLEQFEESVKFAKHATSLEPQNADAWLNLGNSLRAFNKLPEASAAYEQSLTIWPESVDPLVNLCATLTDLARIELAIEAGRKALSIAPDRPEAKYNLSLALLSAGQYREGFLNYESRWACDNYKGTLPTLAEPEWKGGEASFLTILVRAEQGIGDCLQFARYLPVLQARGAKVILQCQDRLVRLMSNSYPTLRVVGWSASPAEFDCHVPMMSLPHRLECDEPPPACYLNCRKSKTEIRDKRFRVGVAWAGNPAHRNDHNRSIDLALLAPLRNFFGVAFYSFQFGNARQNLLASDFGWHDLSPQLDDFADTADAVNEMDLILSVDTSLAHLAGAMRKEVWVMIPHAPDWRWGLHGQTTRWYPTMTLYRQPAVGDWNAVIASVARDLSAVAKSRVAA